MIRLNIGIGLMLTVLLACSTTLEQNELEQETTSKTTLEKEWDGHSHIHKSKSEWKKELSDEAYHITREAGTERPFTGAYWNNKKEGLYGCVSCKLVLFSSDTKFKSGTGWPSFYQPYRSNYIKQEVDNKLRVVRSEVLCARCDAHLGHVFEDGPKPTGLRYCINSAALLFESNN